MYVVQIFLQKKKEKKKEKKKTKCRSTLHLPLTDKKQIKSRFSELCGLIVICNIAFVSYRFR